MNISSNKLNDPTVSVVIPLYNKGKYIKRALNSILAQTHPADEIIVVDDGSTDDGAEKVEKIALSSPQIILIKQENRGPGAARNAGLAIAKSKYISFLDADDEWFPSFVEACLNMLEDDILNISVVSTGYYSYPGMRKNTVRSGDVLSRVFDIEAINDVRLVEKNLNFQSVCFSIIRTDIGRKYGGFYEHGKCTMGEDRYLFIILLFNERVGIIDEPQGIVYNDASGIMVRKWNTFPIPPYIRNPEQILNICPESKQYILKELLYILALKMVKCLVVRGEVREARALFSQFRSYGYPQPNVFFVVLIFVSLPKVIPILYMVRDSFKALKESIRKEISREKKKSIN